MCSEYEAHGTEWQGKCFVSKSTSQSRTVVVLAVHPKEERSALERRTGHAEFWHLWDIVWKRCRIPVGLR